MKMSADIFWCENQQADLKICVKIWKSRNNQNNFKEKPICRTYTLIH